MAGEQGVEERTVRAGSVVLQSSPAPAALQGADPSGSPRGDGAFSSHPGAGVTGRVASFQGWLASLDMETLSDRERVDLVSVLERLKGSASAAQARATHALRCSREVAVPQDVARSVGAEVALARRESPMLGDRFVGLSRALVTELPETMKALAAGAIGERHAVEVAQQSATLSAPDRAELDRRLGPVLGRLGVRGTGNAARRVAAELDAAAVVRGMEAAARSRRVTVRPGPDGMAYLTVLGPMPELVGAYASLRARASAVVGGQCPEERPDGRGTGAVMADTATRLLSGRGVGEAQPVEVHLVMTDRALLGTGDPTRSVSEPARIPGHGSVPAPVARAWLRTGVDGCSGGQGPPAPAGGRVVDGPGGGRRRDASATVDDGAGAAAMAWVRRLYTSPDGRDLVAMDSRRRLFTGLLRRALVLRDDVCTTPWCEAPIAHADHTTPAREGGPTSFAAGNGKCARCNLGKEAPGWSSRVVITRAVSTRGDAHRVAGDARRAIEVTTPLGRVYQSQPPPLLGWGSAPAGTSVPASAPGWAPGRKRPCRRAHALPRPGANRPSARRPRRTSHLERELCRLLT